MDRRAFLGRILTGGACSVAAHPWLTSLTFAGGPAVLGDNRLIVIILRGAMDGLDALRPVGDADLVGLRPRLLQAPGLDLDGFYQMHPALGGLSPLWTLGELGFVHATSTPYRDKRSHFDGQDMLEAGTGMDVPLSTVRDGWLNRMLQAVPGITAETAYAVGRDAIPLLEGPAEVRNWSPEQRLDLGAQTQALLDHIYHEDALFRQAGAEAMELAAELGEEGMMAGATRGNNADIDRLAAFAAERLLGETRIAAFSLTGWDTHRSQERTITRPLDRLARVILQLKVGLGDVWGRTTLIAMTEFGRTARENGSAGTDHGTGGAMVLAGGALRGGRVLGRWPGLAEADLYDRRDLMPTSDVRAWAAAAMQGAYGFDRALLEGTIFPGLDMGASVGGAGPLLR